jgi:N-acetylneuraminic acid mutarotase
MKYRLSFFLWVLGTVLLGQTPHSDLKWDTIAILPADHTAAAPHPGLAGTYAGVHQEVMILAGGANFPEGGVWEGGTKKFHKDIYVLERDGDQWSWMVDSTIQLPFPVAYGASVSTSMGLIGIGGNDASGAKDDVFVLRWNAEERTVEYETLPSLPLPLTNLTAGVIGAEVYVAGSTEPEGKKFFGKLSIEDMEEGWQNLPAWPGAPRTHAVGVVQNNGTGQGFYLFMGRFKGNRVQSQLIQDSWVYDPVHNEWEALDDSLSDKSIPLAAGTGMPVGANHILLFGGDDGRIFNQLETLADRIQKADDPAIWIAQRDSLMQHHPGFNRAVWSFHTITRSWSLLDFSLYSNSFNQERSIGKSGGFWNLKLYGFGRLFVCFIADWLYLLQESK